LMQADTFLFTLPLVRTNDLREQFRIGRSC
jgi:hypothetical protein